MSADTGRLAASGHVGEADPKGRRWRDAGSVMLLFPSALLVVMLLGSIAVDAAIVHLRQRELLDAADAAVNDAVSLAVDGALYQATGEVRLDHSRAEDAVIASLDARDMTRHLSEPPTVRVTADGQIEVLLHTRARRLLGAVIPGASPDTEVVATARASLARSG